MSLHLYQLTGRYAELLERGDQAGDEESERAIRETLAALDGEIATKCDNIAAIVRTWEAEGDALRGEEERLYARRKALESNASRLKDYMRFELEQVGKKDVRGARFSIRLQVSPPKLIVDDETKIPASYFVMKPSLDRASILSDLKVEGRTVAGCHAERGVSVRIM